MANVSPRLWRTKTRNHQPGTPRPFHDLAIVSPIERIAPTGDGLPDLKCDD
jgi:hypothetical protein